MVTAILAAGGGSRGIIQAGYFLAIKDLGIDYDMIFSSSAGTLNSLMFHAGDYEKMYSLWQGISTR